MKKKGYECQNIKTQAESKRSVKYSGKITGDLELCIKLGTGLLEQRLDQLEKRISLMNRPTWEHYWSNMFKTPDVPR